MEISIPADKKDLLAQAGKFCSEKNIKLFAVGGCARDWHLGRQTKDIDLLTDTEAGLAAGFFEKNFGAQTKHFPGFGTCSVSFDGGFSLDIARARKEIYKKPAALPTVSFGSIEDDICRRDFVCNSVCINLLPADFGEIYDPFGGIKDIDGGIIKIFHNKSFEDDPTRLYRAVRFAGRFGWTIEKNTAGLMKQAVKDNLPKLLSRARLKNELMCLLEERNPKPAFESAKHYGLLDFIYPELQWNDAMLKTGNAVERLAVLATGYGAKAKDFLTSLEIDRKIKKEILMSLPRQ